MTSSSNLSQSTRPIGQELWGELLIFLDFTCNYERTSGIFVLKFYFVIPTFGCKTEVMDLEFS